MRRFKVEKEQTSFDDAFIVAHIVVDRLGLETLPLCGRDRVSTWVTAAKAEEHANFYNEREEEGRARGTCRHGENCDFDRVVEPFTNPGRAAHLVLCAAHREIIGPKA